MKLNPFLVNVKKLTLELGRLRQGLGLWFTVEYLGKILLNARSVLKTKSLGTVDGCINKMLNVNCQGYKFLMTPDSMPTVRELMLRNCYMFSMKERYDTVVDLGANSGVFTLMASKVSKRVISVERNTDDLPGKYGENMKNNRVDNALFVNKTVSNKYGNGMVSLNSLMSDHSIEEISFLKMDIEGDEQKIFESNLEWLDKTKEISMEVHPCFGVNEKDLIRQLETIGFNVSLFDKDLNEVGKLDANSMGYIRACRRQTGNTCL